jgi:hypothetical protein
MTEYVRNKLLLEHDFDKTSCRHKINGITAVLHCHHFATLTTQLARDCRLLDGQKLLAECAEDAFYPMLASYYKEHHIAAIKERIELAEAYYSAIGLGKLKVKYAGPYSGEVILEHSHVDEGWIKKWGIADKPVNYIGCGFISALFSALYDRPRREYRAVEQQSIARGAEFSLITVTDIKA